MREWFRPGPSSSVIGCLEVTAESFLRAPETLDDLSWLRDLYPLLSHGVGLSIGSPWGIDMDYLLAVRSVVRTSHAPYHSDHLAITSAPGVELGHLTPLPLTSASLATTAANVHFVQEFLGVPLALENISNFAELPAGELSLEEFLDELTTRTGAGIIVDVTNAWANAKNFGGDALQSIQAMPLDRVAHLHVAGGTLASDGFYVDSHSTAVPIDVLEVLASLGSAGVTAPVILEYDQAIPPLSELADECQAIQSAYSSRAESSV